MTTAPGESLVKHSPGFESEHLPPVRHCLDRRPHLFEGSRYVDVGRIHLLVSHQVADGKQIRKRPVILGWLIIASAYGVTLIIGANARLPAQKDSPRRLEVARVLVAWLSPLFWSGVLVTPYIPVRVSF